MKVRRVVRVMRSPLELAKLAKLRRQASADARDPEIVRFASALARPYRADDWLGISRTVYRWVRDGIRYQHDPDLQEEFAPSSEILSRGWDDCDGKAKLCVALLRALGLDAEVHPVWRGPYLAHVQVRVRFPGSESIRGHVKGWLIGDLTIANAELGQSPFAIASNAQTGKLPLAGG